MTDIAGELLELKDRALAATKAADGEFYRGYLHDDAIAITPYGVFDKEAIVAQMSSPQSSFASESVDDTRAIVLSKDSGLVTYRATYPPAEPGGNPRVVFVTTVYQRGPAGWKGVVYQQTPVMS
jgi:hypothetical protein